VVPRLIASVTDLDRAGVAATAIDLSAEDEDARGVRITAPGGVTVDVIQPAPAGSYESRIGGFIAAAADLAGPPTDELGDAVIAVVAEAWASIDRLLDGVAHNKVLATMLLVSQRSRGGGTDSPAFWQRSAASTLLSGFVGRGAR
jgi:hypothetical protein